MHMCAAAAVPCRQYNAWAARRRYRGDVCWSTKPCLGTLPGHTGMSCSTTYGRCYQTARLEFQPCEQHWGRALQRRERAWFSSAWGALS